MKTTKTIRLDTETRQAQIKKAVLDIIYNQGLAKLSTRNLANRVGVTEGALFRHFNSKKDIIFSILKDVKEELIEELRLIAFSKISADKKLYDFLCRNIRYLIANKGVTILLFTEAAYMNESDLKSELYEILGNQKAYVSKIVEDGIKEGIWDPEIDVNHFSILYMGIPITHNIEMILNSTTFTEDGFCQSMIFLLNKILVKSNSLL